MPDYFCINQQKRDPPRLAEVTGSTRKNSAMNFTERPALRA